MLYEFCIFKNLVGGSVETMYRAPLVVQWISIHLPMQGTWVQGLAHEDPTCRGATKPSRHSY